MARALIRSTVLLLVLVLGLPAVEAAASDQGAFTAAVVQWQAEPASSHIAFVALELRENLGTDNAIPPTAPAAPVQSPAFQIQAKAVEMDSDHSDVFLENGVVKGPAVPNSVAGPSPFVESSHESLTAAHINGTLSREGRSLQIFGLVDAPMQVSVPCANATASQRSEVRAVSLMSAHDQIAKDANGAIEVRPCSDSFVELSGDFVVVVWEWDGTIQAAEREGVFWSGKRPLSQADARPFVTEGQQVYFLVHDGSIRLPGNAERPPVLFANALDLAGASNVTLTRGRGEIGLDRIPAAGHEVSLKGDMNLRLKRAANAVDLAVLHGLHDVAVDGRNVALTSAVSSPTTDPNMPWPALLGVVGLVVSTGAVVVRLHRRRAATRPAPPRPATAPLEGIDDSNDGSSVANLRLMLARRPTDYRAHERLGQALRRIGASREAAQHFETAGRLCGPQAPAAVRAEIDWARALALLEASSNGASRDVGRREARAILLRAGQTFPPILADLDVYPELEELYYPAPRS